jgi:hypothetical protein
MLFINPIEILELQQSDIASIDDNVIKKAKRRLIAEIELSDDGHFNYKQHKLTKSDCEKAIDELGNNDRKEYLYQLAISNQLLNNYLANGDEKIFSTFKQESIYKLPDFVNFVSPYFAYNFDRSLLNAFKSNNPSLVSSILRTQSLIKATDINTAFKSVSIEIQNRIAVIDTIKQEIKEEESNYTDVSIKEILGVVKTKFPVVIINSLPNYFQSQINKIASSINYLQLAIWDTYNHSQVPLDLLEYALKLNIESVGKPIFEKNFEIIKRKNDERIEQERNAPTLKRWASVLIQIKSTTKKVEAKTLTPKEAVANITPTFNISELNSLPSYANEIRNQIAYSFRGLSISSWNDQSDIVSALQLIKLALQINVSPDVKAKFVQDEKQLADLEEKFRGILVCYFCEVNIPNESSKISKTIYKETYRSYIPRRVQFSYVDVDIPRCNSCKEIHLKGNEKYWLLFIGGVIFGAIIGALADGHFIIGGIIGCVVGWMVGNLFESSASTKEGIKNASNSTLTHHPILEQRMKEGWTFSKPSA